MSCGAPLSVDVELDLEDLRGLCHMASCGVIAVSVQMTCDVDSHQGEGPLINGWFWLACPPVGGDVLSSFDSTRVCNSYTALHVVVFRLTVG